MTKRPKAKRKPRKGGPHDKPLVITGDITAALTKLLTTRKPPK